MRLQSARTVLIAIALVSALAAPAFGQSVDTMTISLYDRASELAYFRKPGIESQISRFLLAGPAEVRAITILVSSSKDSAGGRIRLFGQEGGAPVPVLERDLTQPLTFATSGRGVERITISLSVPLRITGNQFFIAVDHLDTAVKLLTDKVRREPACADGRERYTLQAIKFTDGTWSWERFAFALDVLVAVAQNGPRNAMANVTERLGILDTMTSNASIAWYDTDSDSFQDMLWDGRLYQNERGERFADVTTGVGLFGRPTANAFLDVDGDGRLDVLFLGRGGEAAEPSRVFIADPDGRYVAHEINVPALTIPVGFSIGDIDLDEDLDIAIVHRSESGDAGLLLLLNDGSGAFEESQESSLSFERSPAAGSPNAVQLADIDLDGDLDLFVAAGYPGRSVAMLNSGAGDFPVYVETLAEQNRPFGPGNGCHFQDFDNDGDLDLLLPRSIHPIVRKSTGMTGSLVLEGGVQEMPPTGVGTFRETQIDWRFAQSGGAWGDVDNDGDLDLFLSSASPCGQAEIYELDSTGFIRASFDRGIMWTNARRDGIWVDFDNDGHLDLATSIGNRIALLKGAQTAGRESMQIELRDRNPGAVIGARVVLHSDTVRLTRNITMGRGALMSDPYRLHFGLNMQKAPDSVVVEWADGERTVHHALNTGQVNVIQRAAADQAPVADRTHALRIRALPMPFHDVLTLRYAIPFPAEVRLDVLSATGATIATLVADAKSSGEHTATWVPVSSDGKPLPSGAYVYRLSTPDATVSGVAILQR